MATTTLCVATVQLACELDDVNGNLRRATGYIKASARQGAKLVLLPELMPRGYMFTPQLWETAEPFEGPTTRWMCELCRRLGLYMGTTFLEADGEDFFNTFVLMDSQGQVAGCVRKNPPASFEAYYFTAGQDPHGFDTPLGRIGVGICFENALYQHYCQLHAAGIDLYLRPFSGAAFEAKFPVRQRAVDVVNAVLRDGTAETARMMGIPVVISNKVGRLITTLPAGFPSQHLEFPGFSAIADSDGTLIGQWGRGMEGIVVGTVTLDPARKQTHRVPPLFGRWSARMPWWAFLWRLTQKLGERHYARSDACRRRALAISKIGS